MFKKKDNFFEISSSKDPNSLPDGAWKVRPCEWYLEEYKDCKSIKAQFHQYFIFGERVNCSQWQDDYNNCLQFRKKEDIDCLEKVIKSETDRQNFRKETVKQNDVWEYRTSPPDNWTAPMPDWMLENKKNSLLIETQKQLDQGITPASVFSGVSCTIM